MAGVLQDQAAVFNGSRSPQKVADSDREVRRAMANTYKAGGFDASTGACPPKKGVTLNVQRCDSNYVAQVAMRIRWRFTMCFFCSPFSIFHTGMDTHCNLTKSFLLPVLKQEAVAAAIAKRPSFHHD
ncbi:hypothetical protein KEM48_009736 [Puccinia striiformis f. sp. tritici PST-130]|nr:hypothetical protein KEM48_009736 [Puccinia striiformis f. sp. tritici PST-130]